MTTSPRRFAEREEGGMTIWGLFIGTAALMMAALAIDMSQLVAARAQLQAVADAAAHAALHARAEGDASAAAARTRAVEVAEAGMSRERYGAAVRAENIHFGRWNADDASFEIDAGDTARDAVYVRAERLAANGNGVSAFLAQLLGIPVFDVAATSVFATDYPGCLNEGFVALDTVDLQSNNTYSNGFCIHSQARVELNRNNVFEDGVTVSMPDMSQLVTPGGSLAGNPGLEEALRQEHINIRVLGRMDEIAGGFDDPRSDYWRDYLTNPAIHDVGSTRPAVEDLRENQVNEMWCGLGAGVDGTPVTSVRRVASHGGGNGGGNGAGSNGGGGNGGGGNGGDPEPGKATLPGETLRNMVILTDCEVRFAAGAALENVLIVNFNDSARSFTAPSGLRLGARDDCVPGGGAQLVTWGGVVVAAGLEMYGGQILARGDISFAANADGILGASMIAGGRIDGTSNMSFGYCGGAMDESFTAPGFRLRA